MQYLLSLWTINVYSFKTKVKTTQFYGSAAPFKTMVVRKTAHVFIEKPLYDMKNSGKFMELFY